MEKATRRKVIPMVKVIWESNGREETTWETEAMMKAEFPKWYEQYDVQAQLDLDLRTNPSLVGETCSIPKPRKRHWARPWYEQTHQSSHVT
ncbi:hypothetical protein N665_0249s0009 [Sinapis alba]|nr:hypothetical protein N665_0249s0009 [Sinapis alba]